MRNTSAMDESFEVFRSENALWSADGNAICRQGSDASQISRPAGKMRKINVKLLLVRFCPVNFNLCYLIFLYFEALRCFYNIMLDLRFHILEVRLFRLSMFILSFTTGSLGD